jgi:hypothetical protein
MKFLIIFAGGSLENVRLREYNNVALLTSKRQTADRAKLTGCNYILHCQNAIVQHYLRT